MMGSWLPQVMITSVMLAGLYCAVSKRSAVRIVLGLGIALCAINLLLAAMGYSFAPGDGRAGGAAPIEAAGSAPQRALEMVDPLPQAMVVAVTAAGLGVLVLAAAICLCLRERAGTCDAGEIKRLRG